MSPVALVHLDGVCAEPSAEVSSRFDSARSYPLAVQVRGSRIVQAASLATGVKLDFHGVAARNVLDVNPVHLRPRSSSDCGVPWIWDLMAEAGVRAAVVGWPGIVHALGSKVPMASAPSLSIGQGANGRWPLAPLLVSSESVRAEVAAARVGREEITDEELSALDDPENHTGEQVQRHREIARSTLADVKSTARVLEILAADGVEFAAVSGTISYNKHKWSHSIAVAMLDIMIDGVLRTLGPDTFILATSFFGRRGQLVLLSPPGEKKQLDSSGTGVGIFDIAPTTLGLLGLESPEYCIGRDLFESAEKRTTAFDMPVQAKERTRESLMLIEMIERGELQALTARRRSTLTQFLRQRLSEEWADARVRFDFRDGARIAEMMVRVEANETSLWRLAFARQHMGDSDGATEASQRLLETFPGSPAALLSGVLGSTSGNADELRAIVDAVDPSSMRLSSMWSAWGRAAIMAGRVDEGLTVLERAITGGSALLVDRVFAATAARSGGDNARALRLLGAVGKRQKAPLNRRILRARLLLANGQDEEACTLANQILEAFPLESRAKAIIKEAGGSGPPTP